MVTSLGWIEQQEELCVCGHPYGNHRTDNSVASVRSLPAEEWGSCVVCPCPRFTYDPAADAARKAGEA